MGRHEANFKVFLEYKSPARAAFELHMEVPLRGGEEDPAASPAEVRAAAQRLMDLLDAEDWIGASSYLQDHARSEQSRQIIKSVFELRSSLGRAEIEELK
jgi:hypothetical protein